MIPKHLREAIEDAKRRPDRPGESEFGLGPAVDREEVAPLVNRAHRRNSAPPPVPIKPIRPRPGLTNPHLAD